MEQIFRRYLDREGAASVVIGDIVDRAKDFRSNLKCLELLFTAKIECKNVYMLRTNHLTYEHYPFYPADFWHRLTRVERRKYTEVFDFLPLAAISDNGIIAVHGLPVRNLGEINQIRTGASDWHTLLWGRLSEPFATPEYISSVLEQNGKAVVIRSHDHYCRLKTHNNKVLTFTTSKNLPRTRRLIAVVDLTKKIRDLSDVKIIDLDEVS